MGPQGKDPVCPCAMRRQGLQPTNAWDDPYTVQRLHEALDKWIKQKNVDSILKE